MGEHPLLTGFIVWIVCETIFQSVMAIFGKSSKNDSEENEGD